MVNCGFYGEGSQIWWWWWGELGLAFVVFSMQVLNIVWVLAFLVLTVPCWSSLVNETTAKHKAKSSIEQYGGTG